MKQKWFTALALAALLLAVAAPAPAAAEGEGSLGILYHVTGGKSDMYLLGSIHIGNEAMYPFGGEIEAAMAAADTFVYECDTTSQAAVEQVRERMKLPQGQTLREALGEGLYQTVGDTCAAIGLDSRVLDGIKPWAVVNTLAVFASAAELGSQDISQALSLGVETAVSAYAQQNGKSVVYLETLDQQLSMLEGFSEKLVGYLLTDECDAILNPDSARGLDASIASWPAWWREGQADTFAQQYLRNYIEPGYEDECAEYHRKLVTQRNAFMADRLAELLTDGHSYFVTVGLMHLVLPEDSIVALLQQKGYTVERVTRPLGNNV